MKYLIVGTGAVGLALMDELAKRGNEILLINRSGKPQSNFPLGVKYQQLDATDTKALIALSQGYDFIIHAGGVAIERAKFELPILMQSIIEAAVANSIKLIYLDSMAAYGDNLGIPMSEATPERPVTAEECLRAELGHQLQAAIRDLSITALIARSCTLYGPRVIKSALGEAVFAPVIAGKPALMLGRLDMPHAYTFVRDMARSTAILSEHDEGWGRVWHIPCPQPITQQQILDILRDMLSRSVKADTINSRMLGLKTLFNPDLKKYADELYHFEKPYVVNHSRFSTTFGERTTSHTQALFETLEWFKQRSGITRRYGI